MLSFLDLLVKWLVELGYLFDLRWFFGLAQATLRFVFYLSVCLVSTNGLKTD